MVENQPVSLQGKWEEDEGERGGGGELLWVRYCTSTSEG